MPYRIGIDAGSKTLKLIVLDEDGAIILSTYQRHHANIIETLADAIHDLNWRLGPLEATVAMTGSAAIEIAAALEIPFVQEVVATTAALRTLTPDADVAIELGGEDAKIIYLTGGIEQRMNASCAGGTGGFIDSIAYMLNVRPSEMSSLAFGASRRYPIASRCAVFAQSDVRPLLNAGASKADIAASVYDAVVHQTLGGLACGRPIRGKVVFLGGPLEHMPFLAYSFRHALNLNTETGLKPDNAHLFTVLGAAFLSENANTLNSGPTLVNTAVLEERIKALGPIKSDLELLAPLFANEAEYAAFMQRHDQAHFAVIAPFETEGPLYLGIDAGSTTLKLVAIDQDERIVFKSYEPVQGNLIETFHYALAELYRFLEPPSYEANAQPKSWIARACATGYGEEMLRAAFGVDEGIVETTSHLESAKRICPDLDFLLDIGGQDIKALWVRNGIVVDAALNEACSSGCGAFIEGTAAALNRSPAEFAELALAAKQPIDLGTKCTVFMNSRVKQAQKSGVPIEDIAAGISYSVVKNALHRIIGDDRKPKPGDKVVVQGGTFKSDAVLRAFELVSGLEVLRPAEAEFMGAIGCALHARATALSNPDTPCSLISPAELEALKPRQKSVVCTGCGNACKLSVVTFDDEGKRYFITGNQCEKGLDELKRRSTNGNTPSLDTKLNPPNVVAFEQEMLASFGDLIQGGERGSLTVALMDTMALYAYRPFWHALWGTLGFSIVLPETGCEEGARSEAWETIPSESVCYPAKLTHVRYFSLCEKECDAIFMPRFARSFHCPVQTRYAEALEGNVSSGRNAQDLAPLISPELANYKPGRFMRDEDSVLSLLDSINDFIGDRAPQVTAEEMDAAMQKALAVQSEVTELIEAKTAEAFEWLRADPARHGIVLAGRPYHMDDALLHGIDRALVSLGFAVFTAAGLDELMSAQKHKRLGGVHPWIPAKRLVRLAHAVAADPQLDAVFLQSFGCGYEPLTIAEATDVLDEAGKPCTVLMLDDISDLAHIRIRLRTQAAAIQQRNASPRHPERRAEGPASLRHPERRAEGPASLRHPERRAEGPESKDLSTTSSSFRKIEAGSMVNNDEATLRADASLLQSIAEEPLNAADLECARSRGIKDICFTANVMAARIIRMLEKDPSIKVVALPEVCETCLTQAIPRIVERTTNLAPEYIWTSWSASKAASSQTEKTEADPTKPHIGILGNPLLVFEPFMNDNIIEKLDELGCEAVLPDPELISGEDVRYLEQLEAFEKMGIRDVLYLLSFGCLKGHVQGRGALRELRDRFPSMSITVIDFDPETSALNRENRVRLAADSAISSS